MSRAETELHAGRFSAALQLLNAHQKSFPRGLLRQERVAARIAGTIVADSTMAPPRSISVATGTGSAKVAWSTLNDPSDTQLRYWPNGYPSRAVSTRLDITFVQKHAVSLTGLARGGYQYQIIDADKAGNRRVSGILSFRVS